MAYLPEYDYKKARAAHKTITIGNRVFNWGGQRSDIPKVHDDELKKILTSRIEVFDMATLSWSSTCTTGVPPAAVMFYSCCSSLGGKMYLFGGSCMLHDCYHNDLFTFDTSNKEWRQVDYIDSPATNPMKKRAHEMVSFAIDNEEYLFVFGGFGPSPTFTPSHGQYVPHPVIPNTSYTNEVHMLCVTPSIGTSAGWTIPVVTGTTPLPTVNCTLNKLPSRNKAVHFGGFVADGNRFYRTDDVHIVTFTKDQVDFKKLDCTNSPKGRESHSSTVATVDGSVYLFVMGGLDVTIDVANDFWILNIHVKQWKKVDIPDTVCKRFDHSITSIVTTYNRVWIVVNGGFNCYNKTNGSSTAVTGANVTVLVELECSNNNWSVVGIWNSEQLMSKKSEIHCELVQQLIDEKYDKRTLSELITTLLSAPKGLKLEAQLAHSQFELYQEQKEVIKRLQSDLALYKEGLLINQKKLNQCKEIAELQRKMLLGKTLEIEQMKENKAKVTTEQLKQADKLEALKEVKVATKQDKPDDRLEKQRETSDKQTVDIGVQFNYVSRETDRLQGVTILDSQLFTVHGDQPHSFIWEGFGFELHVSEGTCLPDQECDVIVDAVIGGDFLFPRGVEPVSVIYIISIASKPPKPSLLKLQHCVALDKASKHSQLNFYRATLKEPTPPYHFRCIKGGRFDINSQYGQLELPVFCSMCIGKESTSTDESTGDFSRDELQAKSTPDYLKDSVEDLIAGRIRVPLVDSSIVFLGQVFYLEKHLNQWEMRLIIVKHLEAFANYVKSELENHEANITLSLRFSADNIELVLNGKDTDSFEGWAVELFVKPCIIPFKHALSFGYKVCIPPTCLVAVYGKNSVPNYADRLSYPVLLRGALVASEEPILFIKRTMKEKDDLQTHESLTKHQQDKLPQQPDDQIVGCIREVIDKSFPKLKKLFENDLEGIAAEMLGVGLIPHSVATSPSFESIIQGFYSSFSFLEDMEEIKVWCGKFLSSMHKMGGAFNVAADKLEKQLKDALKHQF